MLDKSQLKFQRQFFVKDLYKPVGFLNNFSIVEFLNLSAFSQCIQNEFYEPKGEELIIHIYTEEDFKTIIKIITHSGLTGKCRLSLHIHCKNSFHLLSGIGEKQFALIIDEGVEIDWKENKEIRDYLTQNPVFMQVLITFENIDTIFEQIIDWYMNRIVRLFDLKIDYESFQKATLNDLHRIYFRFNRFVAWKSVAAEMKQGYQLLLKMYPDSINKRILIDQKLQLYYNRRHYTAGTLPPLFTLQKDKTGEDIPYLELNLIRQYIDLNREVILIPDKRNLNWVDFYQNVRIQGVVNEIPYITELIHRWLQ